MEEPTRSGVSQRYEMALDGWLADCRAAGNMDHAALPEGEYWEGGDETWPEWLSVEAVVLLVLRDRDETISKQVVGRWMNSFGVASKDLKVDVRLRGGANTQQKHRRVYDVSSWKHGTLY